MQAAGKTDRGMVRAINQDFIFASTTPVGPLPNLFLVADGMGGHNAGDYASRFLVEFLVDYIGDQPKGKPEVTVLQEGIQAANRAIYQKAQEQEELYGMGTTLVAAVYADGLLLVANVGDSRLYTIGKRIRQITRDHSYVEEMVAQGKMKRGSLEYFQNKNIITRAVGTSRNVHVDFFEQDIKVGDYFLLCSDGLTNMVEDPEIKHLIQTADSLEKSVDALIETANTNGGRDNISAVLVNTAESGVKVC